jgi:hypothetical protein
MSSLVLAPPHAILFIFDPSNKNVEIPEYVDGELTAENHGCISVGTQPDVDGETTVTLGRHSEGVDLTGLSRVFEGRIETPGRKLAIVTSESQSILERDLGSTEAEVSIWVDDAKNPGRVTVMIE